MNQVGPRQRVLKFGGTSVAEVLLIGAGRVGRALLRQLRADGAERAERGLPPRIRVTGIARSTHLALHPEGIGLDGWEDRLTPDDDPLERVVEAATLGHHHPRVVVDCTADPAPVRHYERLLREGVSVVCANKLGFSGPIDGWDALRAATVGGAHLLHETTVGAALPLLRTISDLRETGDRVRRIEGVLSGTTAFLFDRLGSGMALSEAVREAHALGYTEPDPREDLSGRDVARKMVILAREAGLRVEPDQVVVAPLIEPGRWADLPLYEFWEFLGTLDEQWRGRVEEAAATGRRLACLARIDDGSRELGVAAAGLGSLELGVTAIGPDHPAWMLRGTDNLVAIHSDRYDPTPLVVAGPGAGSEVTAAGLFADVLRARAEAGELRWSARRSGGG